MPSILVVDDEPALGRAICDFVARSMPDLAKCVEKSRGSEAFEFLASDEGVDVRLVIVDLQLPDMDGRELIRSIAAHIPRLRGRIVVCTGEPLSDEDPLFVTFGCGYLDKPFDLDELRGMVLGAVTNG